MTNAQNLQLRASGIRQRLNEIGGLTGDAYTAEIRAESDTLTAEFTDLETRHRAALVIESDETEKRDRAYPTGETRERIELRAKTGIGDFLRAAAGGAAVTGAAAEYASSLGVPTTGHLPMAIFARTPPTVETRAITPGPAVKGGATADRPVRVRAVGGGEPRDHDAVRANGPGTDTKNHHSAACGHAGEGRRGSGDGGGGHAGQSGSRPHRGPVRGPSRGSGRHADTGSGAVRVVARQHEQ